jgi:hypothetical protein
MNRRSFLKNIALVPAVPFAALAGPTPVGAQDIRAQRYLFRVNEYMPSSQLMHLRRAVHKWESGGYAHSFVLPDSVEVFRL